MKIGLPFSLSVIFWSFIGALRLFSENFIDKKIKISSQELGIKSKKVAVLIPAHNEEGIILNTILSVKRNVPPKQIYVVSDGSTDKTAEIARTQRCNVLNIYPSVGKAKALKATLKKFKVLNNYDFVLFVDADTLLAPDYVNKALRFFIQNPQTAAIAAYAQPIYKKGVKLTFQNFISSYRTKLYKMLQIIFMYGQTWNRTNVNPVIPGFAAMYPVKVLKKLRLDTPGIWIEDFNLAFQIHKKKLGKIGHHPTILARYQDPATLKDYMRQVGRWNVGFFQTIRFQGIWPSFFWLSLGYFSTEVLLFAFFTLFLPISVFVSTIQYFLISGGLSPWNFLTSYLLTLLEILFGFFLLDYVLTIFVALKEKKYNLLFYGLGFMFFQFLNSLILISSIGKGFFSRSNGIWTPVLRK